ncbi:hypothetical protein DSL72_002748 [Monilinia vaccinii-corymbosi]|uniref:Peptidase A1 domain-containing protein n=1 Tax=Monilinia vaccinii-corymbosi TaxID=61207 RepID=A0A8A3PDA7_9HELO|nr:hypothetical protein DSL72_002748 [Monilinia vaccinii-corymbosi]
MEWKIFLTVFISWALPVISSPCMPVDPTPNKVEDAKYGYENPQIRSSDVNVVSALGERHSNLDLGTFSLAKRLKPNDILFSFASKAPVGPDGAPTSNKAICLDCSTTGKAIITTSGLKTDESALKDSLKFSLNPTDVVVNALNLDLRLDFKGVTGHFELDVAFGEAESHSFPLFASENPLGIQLNDKDEVGLIFEIELTFTVSGEVEIIAGFDVEFPDDAYIILNPLSGELVKENLKGIKINALPAKFKSGAACVAVGLRYKLKVGTGVKVLGIGFEFEAGAYIDAPQYRACITYQPTKPCKYEFKEGFDVVAAVYAQAVENLDFISWSAGPTASTTLYAGPLPSKCLRKALKSEKSIPASSKTHGVTLTPEPKTTPQTPAHTSTTKKTESTSHPRTSTKPSSSAKKTETGYAHSPTIPGKNATATRTDSGTHSSTRLTINLSGFPTGAASIPSYGYGSSTISGTEGPAPSSAASHTALPSYSLVPAQEYSCRIRPPSSDPNKNHRSIHNRTVRPIENSQVR